MALTWFRSLKLRGNGKVAMTEIDLSLGQRNKNNFDLLRLMASFQVAILHAIGHLGGGGDVSWLTWVLECISGGSHFLRGKWILDS